MFSKLKNTISRHLLNSKGWRTHRKIIVIESDDWGSIRMPSREVYEKALRSGYRVDLNEYEKNDCLLSENDLQLLFEVLRGFKDINGRFPIITANCVVANPDFQKIMENDYDNYYFESIIKTFKKYPNHKKSFQLWKEGLSDGLLKFQYHAREHLNVSLFMAELNKQNKDVLWGFDNQMPGMINIGGHKRYPNPYVEATRFLNYNDMISKMKIFFHGFELFKSIFNYAPETIIPTNYFWNKDYDAQLKKNGVIAIQGNRKLINPLDSKIKNLYRFNGNQRKSGLINLVRNNSLELSIVSSRKLEFDNCLQNINYSFLMNKPSIISMHRINFAGEIFEHNRNENLNYLYDILKNVKSRWPDVEFLSSDLLAREIINS